MSGQKTNFTENKQSREGRNKTRWTKMGGSQKNNKGLTLRWNGKQKREQRLVRQRMRKKMVGESSIVQLRSNQPGHTSTAPEEGGGAQPDDKEKTHNNNPDSIPIKGWLLASQQSYRVGLAEIMDEPPGDQGGNRLYLGYMEIRMNTHWDREFQMDHWRRNDLFNREWSDESRSQLVRINPEGNCLGWQPNLLPQCGCRSEPRRTSGAGQP